MTRQAFLILTAATLATGALALLVPAGVAAVRILTLPLVLILPGYACSTALWPGHDLRLPERLVTSLGFSIAAVILGALLLNRIPSGLSTRSWTGYLGGVTLVAGAVAYRRMHPDEGAGAGSPLRPSLGLTLGHTLLFGLAAVIIAGAFAVSITGARRQTFQKYTQLWILPVRTGASSSTVTIGTSNGEGRSISYRLSVSVADKVVRNWPVIYVKSGGTWQITVSVPMQGKSQDVPISAILRSNGTIRKVYRHAFIWVHRAAVVATTPGTSP